MDYKGLAELLFPCVDKTIAYYEKDVFPNRDLAKGAKVTRLAPSPTGFIHLGNLYGAFVDERLARQSDGVFLLRIEDTDEKRKVDGAVEVIISSLEYFGLKFDEGATQEGEFGNYGPYYQSNRKELYHVVAKHLVEIGRAYPCFCTEEELDGIRKQQVEKNVNTGYYGKWALDRDLPLSEVKKRLDRGQEYVLRFKSMGTNDGTFEISDAIRGNLSLHENFQDIVLLKANGIPTYHFAHVVDDHFMRVTHVVRGEEWLSSLPIHYELFNVLGWDLPVYCHTAHLMKIDNGVKRKLSKRKDPELGLDYYMKLGYFPEAVREYLMTILNSNYEEWRMKNPNADSDEFKFSLNKMSNSGALFDIDKLNDVSKNVLVKMPVDDIYDFMLKWAQKYRRELVDYLAENRDEVTRLLSIGRDGKKPRKDLVYCQQIFDFIKYFFDDYYNLVDDFPENIDELEAKKLLKEYMKTYDYNDDQGEWFSKIRNIAVENGYAAKPKEYKKNPSLYKGHVGDVSTVVRLAIVGKKSSPDLWEIQQIMGKEKVMRRIENLL